jgi:Pput_2613-like deaminase
VYISPDPLGYEATLNLYEYCPNPVDFVDPFGLKKHHASCVLEAKDSAGKQGTFLPSTSGGVLVSGSTNQKRGPGKPDFILGAMRPDGAHYNSGKPLDTESSNVGYWLAHTEQNGVEWAEHHFDQNQLLGSKMTLGGELPPCDRCHQKMRKFAADHKASVQYHYPINNKMQYDGTSAGKNGVPKLSSSGQNANRLKAEYDASDKKGVFVNQEGQRGSYLAAQGKLGSDNYGLGGKAAHRDPNAKYANLEPNPVPPPPPPPPPKGKGKGVFK